MKLISRIVIIFLGSTFLSACGFDATISAITYVLPDVTTEKNRSEPDFVNSEIVSVPSSLGLVVITGSFGDITTEVKLNNGIVIEGAFYQ